MLLPEDGQLWGNMLAHKRNGADPVSGEQNRLLHHWHDHDADGGDNVYPTQSFKSRNRFFFEGPTATIAGSHSHGGKAPGRRSSCSSRAQARLFFFRRGISGGNE